MSETNISKADIENAAKPAIDAGRKLQNIEGLGHKLKDGFETAERIHFIFEICSWLFAPAAFLKGWAMIAGRALFGVTVPFWSLLIFTAPLTVAVAVIAICLRRDWFSDTPIIRLPFAGIVLVLAAYLSNWSGIGRAFDWADVVLHSQWLGSNSIVDMIMEWFRLLYFALVAYYHVYGFWPFALSIVAGIAMGRVVKEHTAPATQLTAQRSTKRM